MRVLSIYVARLFLMRFVLILGTMLALMQLLDFLANAADITQNSEQPIEALLRYGWLRLPDMASQIMPFTVLIAALVTLASLAQDNEIVVMKMAGVSYYQVLRALIPVGLAIGFLHFYIADQLVPKAAPLVREIDPEFDRTVGQDRSNSVWLKDGKDIVNAESVASNGRHIVDLRIYQRDSEGRLLGLIEAGTADYVDGHWNLRSVRRASTESRTVETMDSMPWNTELRPRAFDWLATLPKELPVERLWRFINNPDMASRPIYYYSTWLYERLSLPVKSVLMLLLAAPAAQILRRRSGLGPALVLGFGIGFLFFVMDGVAVTMGEAGKLPPMLAAWISTIIFVSGGTALLLQVER